MKRRDFFKVISAAGTSMSVPATFTIHSLLNKAYAASPQYNNAQFDVGALQSARPLLQRFPQVINVFLYGGPSELSGNLSIIDNIAANSQSSYTNNIPGIAQLQNDASGNGKITPRGFWGNSGGPGGNSGAGGDIMEFLVENNYMTVYRTMMKRTNDTRSHRESIFQTQKGTTDVESRPGIGTTLANLLYMNRADIAGHSLLGGKNIEDLILPFVSFEGESTVFAPDPDNSLPLRLRYTTLGEDLENPFNPNDYEDNNRNNIFTDLVSAVNTQSSNRFNSVMNSFASRKILGENIGNLEAAFEAPIRVSNAGISAADLATDFTDNGDGTSTLNYPNNQFARQIRAAVTLAVENPDSLYIQVGNVGLGGWDDHNNGCDRYAGRMNDLFSALQVAVKHIKYAGTQTAGISNTPGNSTLSRRTDNILINVYGEFGRRCNLNGSCGWDHGNCQNLFTLGGAATRPAGALGKVVGTTVRNGDAGTNNQFQVPVAGSYEFEPASVAASIYAAFGVQNPQALTADEVLNPAGSAPIDETQPNSQALLF
ncbi:MAG: DUF1501 domain-containing protein [Gammaproteobacteria bacterium]|nr:DUF1501 domain-containing protein [Gammaproteobacteria bacterium]